MKKIVLASHNFSKLEEIINILKKENINNIDVVLAKDFNLEAPHEYGTSFEENALIKAKFVSESTGLISISDDSGLYIDSLEGYPGVYSADVIQEFGLQGAFNNIFSKLENKSRLARFISVICLYFTNGEHVFFKGEIEGLISDIAIGDNGFAYDKIFIPQGYNITFAQMTQEQKNSISHRKKALTILTEYIKTSGKIV